MPQRDAVAILGAGELGGALAHALVRRDSLSAIALIDDKAQLAAGKALDILQAGPIDGFSTLVSGGTDLYAAAGASVIVIADRANGGEWQGDDGLLLIRRVVQLSPAVIVCAGATHRELVERAVRELHVPARRIFGSAPEALASAVRAMIALETKGSPADVALSILGSPPAHVVLPWEEATIGGLAATKMLDEPARRRINSRLAALWPPGPYSLAAAAAKSIDALVGRTRRVLSAFADGDERQGDRTRTVALPVRLGPVGIERIELPELSAHDRVALDNARLF